MFPSPIDVYTAPWTDLSIRPAHCALATAVLVVVGASWMARRYGRRLTLAGWMLGPMVGIAVLLGLVGLPTADLGGTEQRAHHIGVAWQALADLGAGLVGTGIIIGGLTLLRPVRRLGASSRMATWSALISCVGFTVEAARVGFTHWAGFWPEGYASAAHAYSWQQLTLTATLGVALRATLLPRPRHAQVALTQGILLLLVVAVLCRANAALQVYSD